MAGNNSVVGLETITFTDNMSFDGTERGGAMTTNGQLWIGATALPHVKKGTITSPDGSVVIGYSSPNITLQVSSSIEKFPWTVIGASQTLAINNGYICTTGAALSLALPAISTVGDEIDVVLDGSTSWTITQPNAATQIRIGNTQTTLGVGGTLASTAVGDTVRLICETANARWVVIAMMGNVTIV